MEGKLVEVGDKLAARLAVETTVDEGPGLLCCSDA